MQAKCVVSREIIGWLMLDLARSTTSGNLCHFGITRRNPSKPTAGGTLLTLVLLHPRRQCSKNSRGEMVLFTFQ